MENKSEYFGTYTSADVLQVNEAATAAEEVLMEQDKNYHVFLNRLNMTLRIETTEMGLDTPAQRQHGKLILLPQDVHPALRSHPPQCFLLFQVKETLCFSWTLVHQDLLPAHRKKKKKKTTKGIP